MASAPAYRSGPLAPVHNACSRQYGVTPPISTNLPTERDLEMTEDLVSTLTSSSFFETEKESEKR